MDCPICCESVKKGVECGFCDLTACANCCEKYLLSSFDDPHCMGCKNEWDREFLNKNFSKVFVTKKLKRHREDVLFEREKSMFPHSQNHIDMYVLKKNIQKTKNDIALTNKNIEIKVCEIKLKELMFEAEVMKGSMTPKEMSVARKENKAAVSALMTEKRGNERLIQMRHHRVYSLSEIKTNKGKCPMEGCKGYVSDDWACGVCEKKICKHCMEEETHDHVCDPDTVETVRAIKKDSKPCPGCDTRVIKESGCDQMWCVQCHVAFSWKTGQRVNGQIHNPHYIQWMNRNGGMDRDPRDVPCGGLVNYDALLRSARKHSFADAKAIPKLGSAYVIISHVTHVELPRYITNGDQNGLFRAMYLVGDMSEDEFKNTIQREEKKREKIKSFGSILTMYTHTAADIFRNIASTNTSEFVVEQIHDLYHLTKYTCEQLHRITNMYDCAMIRMNGMRMDSRLMEVFTPLSSI